MIFVCSLQSFQNGSLNKFYCLRNTTFTIFPFLCELWRYACSNSFVRSLTRNTSHWLFTSFTMPARCSRGSLIWPWLKFLCELCRKKRIVLNAQTNHIVLASPTQCARRQYALMLLVVFYMFCV